MKTFAGCSVNRKAPGRSQAEGDERNSPRSQHGKGSPTGSHISLRRGEITSSAHFDASRNPRVPGSSSLSPSFPHPPSPPLCPSSCTHLCDLVQQFVVFLPFLQGAQIATHSSCQGNGAGYPMECLPCTACAVCPRGRIHSSSATSQLLLICMSSGPPLPSTGCECRTHTPLQKLDSGVSGPCRRASLPSLPVTPSSDSSSHAYIRSPLLSSTSSSQCERTDARTGTFGSWGHTSHGSPPSHACSG